MPLYLSRFSYTAETWARMIENAHDGYNLWEAPDNVSMAAVALAISGGNALSSFETTVLLTVDEAMDALKKAAQVRYRAPGAQG